MIVPVKPLRNPVILVLFPLGSQVKEKQTNLQSKEAGAGHRRKGKGTGQTKIAQLHLSFSLHNTLHLKKCVSSTD